jgi:signal transduction histidine kinase/DNA-binding response OmpR family regulator
MNKERQLVLNIFLIFLSVFLVTQNVYGQDTGFKYFRNYSYKEYDHQPQNWGIIQAKNGIIYVANNGGVLEFDGVSWRVIKVPGYNPVRSMAIDETGTIYIGGKNKIGYLAPDAKGSLKYVSLLNQLEDNQKNFSNVWKTYAIGQQVYFYSSSFLFRWDSGQKKLVGLAHGYKALLNCGKKIYLRGDKAGLEHMKQMGNDGMKIETVVGGETFAKKKIYMMTPYKSNSPKLLIGTYQNGLYISDGKATIPFPTEVDGYLKKNKLYHGIRLSSGDFALATLLGGLVIMTPQGSLKYIFDKTYGLLDDKVYYVFEDHRGNLWLCLSKGISMIEYASSISIHDERSHLTGLVLSITRHRDHLFVGTANGLYYLESPLKFRLIPGIYGYCWSLLSTQDSLLAAASEGVFQVEDKNHKVRRVIEEQSFALLPSVLHPDRTWCGTSRGLVMLSRKNGRWMEEHRFKGINQGIISIVEDKKGDLWLGTSAGSVLKIGSPIVGNQAVVTPYNASHGLPEGGVYKIATVAGQAMFATGKGIFRFEEKDRKFIPDQTLGVEFSDGAKPVFRIVEDKNKNIWFHSESMNYQAIPAIGGGFTIHSKALRRIPTTAQVNVIYPDPDGRNVWFGSIDGLIHYDTTIKKNDSQGFKTLVRKVLVNGGLIFDGYKNKIHDASQNLSPIIKHIDRNLHFEFAAPFFEADTETRYRCYLEGYDGRWPAWNEDTKRDYTNLDAGLYTFRVQARNVYQQESVEDVFRFKILSPWYKTWWAFVIYTILFFLLVFLIVKWQSMKLEREKQRLEQIVKDRTREINDKNHQLENQTLKLQDQSEKLKEMDTVKSRFFANISHEFRTPLTLIMGPLEKMLSKGRDQDGGNELNMMFRNSQRLLRLINRLLDLSKLDSGKMKLNILLRNIIPFIKVTVSSFESLTLQKQIELNLDIEDEEVILSFDPEKLEEVLCNLLINALKYTPPGGKVTVSTRRGPAEGSSFPNGYLKLSIRDTGIGISRDKLFHIFDRFYQAGDSQQRDRKGSGIGLALTKELVLLHNGRIDVHSSGGENSGTEFVVRLPLGDPHLETSKKTGSSESGFEQRKTLDIDLGYIVEDDEIETAETPEPMDENGKSQGKNIVLVVEDNADVRKYIREPLEPLYTVVEAKDGREGIDKAKELIPDLIVSDIMMPEVDGYELCRVLKKEVKTSHIPIILLTAKASDQCVIEGLETGADDYITKPFNTRILITRIRNLIELRLHLQQKIQKQMLLQPAEISVSSLDQEFISELQQTIEAHLSDPEFHVEALSKKLYMNRVTLYRKIMALTGESPTQFIRSYRLKRAAQLLRDNAGNVSEVALEVGIFNLGYFTRCFKEKFHQLPSTYQTPES